MAGGWTRDGAVQDQIDDTVKDAVLAARDAGPLTREGGPPAASDAGPATVFAMAVGAPSNMKSSAPKATARRVRTCCPPETSLCTAADHNRHRDERGTKCWTYTRL